jgi:hypothetical protein
LRCLHYGTEKGAKKKLSANADIEGNINKTKQINQAI